MQKIKLLSSLLLVMALISGCGSSASNEKATQQFADTLTTEDITQNETEKETTTEEITTTEAPTEDPNKIGRAHV